MKHYGLEFEFFIQNEKGEIIPAYRAGGSTDGDPFIGEVCTEVHSCIYSAIYELKKLIAKECDRLINKGYEMVILDEFKITKAMYKDLRRSSAYCNSKEMELLDAKSIYFKNTGKVLPKGTYKTSLQISISDNEYSSFNTKEGKNMVKHTIKKSNVFDFASIIRHLDDTFKKEIKEAKRVKGVYAIKAGSKGDRIEYRSLPASTDLDLVLAAILETKR